MGEGEEPCRPTTGASKWPCGAIRRPPDASASLRPGSRRRIRIPPVPDARLRCDLIREAGRSVRVRYARPSAPTNGRGPNTPRAWVAPVRHEHVAGECGTLVPIAGGTSHHHPAIRPPNHPGRLAGHEMVTFQVCVLMITRGTRAPQTKTYDAGSKLGNHISACEFPTIVRGT